MNKNEDGIYLENLTLSYERHPAVHHANGSFLKGTSTAILGPNGGGKSTLLKALAGLHQIDEGKIIRQNLSLEQTAYLAQTIGFEKDFPITVQEVIAQGHFTVRGFFKNWQSNKSQNEKIKESLYWTNLENLANKPIRTLSFGQLQRVRWARLMVQNPEVFLLDEPFVGVDESSTTDLLRCLEQWKLNNKTIIFILHDTNMALQHFTHTMYLAKNIKAWGLSKDVLIQPDRVTQPLVAALVQDNEVCSQ